MFLETIQNQAEQSNSENYSFPMLVASKVDAFNGGFTHTQIFSKIVAEQKQNCEVLNTEDIYLEITGQVADLPLNARSNSLFFWTALRDYPVRNASKLLSITLHSLRVALFVQAAKNIKQSKLLDPAFHTMFFNAVDACYPGIDLKNEQEAIVHVNLLLGKSDFNLAEIEGPFTGCSSDKVFSSIDRVVYQAAELLFEKMGEAISIERVTKIRQAVYLTRFTY